MITVNTLYLGSLRLALGREKDSFDVEDRTTIFGLRRMALRSLGPAAALHGQGLVFTVDNHQVALNHVLKSGDTVAFLPPGLKSTGHGKA